MGRLAIAALAALACVNFVLNLGSSSLFVDEVYSWGDASTPLTDLIARLRDNEVTPPAYFAGLHAWIGWFGADSDWAMRLPSVVFAVALVPVLYDVGRGVAGHTSGIAAALLGALSPLVLDYAQQVRGYALAMLLCAAVAACALRAMELTQHRFRWALAAGTLAALAYTVHYTTAFATAPFLVWITFSGGLRGWRRGSAAAPLALVGLLLLPLMLDQLESGRQAAISPFARFTLENVLEVLGTPWDGRAEDPAVVHVFGAMLTVPAIAWLFAQRRAADVAVAAAASAPVVAAFVATVLSDDAMTTRYTSISAPFAIVAVGAACARLPRAPRTAYMTLLLLVAVAGTMRGHTEEARFADARAAVKMIGSDWRGSDVIVTPRDDVTVNLPVLYYAGRSISGSAEVVPADESQRLAAALASRRRIWFVGRETHDPAPILDRAGFDSEVVASYGGTVPLVVTRAVRRSR